MSRVFAARDRALRGVDIERLDDAIATAPTRARALAEPREAIKDRRRIGERHVSGDALVCCERVEIEQDEGRSSGSRRRSRAHSDCPEWRGGSSDIRPARSGSLKTTSRPAGRCDVRREERARPGSRPASRAASPVASVDVHLPAAGVGYVPSQCLAGASRAQAAPMARWSGIVRRLRLRAVRRNRTRTKACAMLDITSSGSSSARAGAGVAPPFVAGASRRSRIRRGRARARAKGGAFARRERGSGAWPQMHARLARALSVPRLRSQKHQGGDRDRTPTRARSLSLVGDSGARLWADSTPRRRSTGMHRRARPLRASDRSPRPRRMDSRGGSRRRGDRSARSGGGCVRRATSSGARESAARPHTSHPPPSQRAHAILIARARARTDRPRLLRPTRHVAPMTPHPPARPTLRALGSEASDQLVIAAMTLADARLAPHSGACRTRRPSPRRCRSG